MPPQLTTQNQENNAFCGTIDHSSPPLDDKAAKGKTLFNSMCASCHKVFKDATGPALAGYREHGAWKNEQDVLSYIRDPDGYSRNSKYVKALRKKYGFTMTAFPDLTEEDMSAIDAYINAHQGY